MPEVGLLETKRYPAQAGSDRPVSIGLQWFPVQ